MGISKTEVFSTAENELSTFAKALGHPARIAILKILFKKDQCICGDIVDELPLAQSTISQHLKALKEAGLIEGNVEGPSTCYCIDKKNWAKIQKSLTRFLSLSPNSKNNCC